MKKQGNVEIRTTALTRLVATLLVASIFPVLCATFSLPVSHAAPPQLHQSKEGQHIETVKSEFLRLRNTDPQAKQVQEWLRFARQFDELAKRAAKSGKQPSSAPWMLLNSAIAYQQLYRSTAQGEYLKSARARLIDIEFGYTKHKLAPTALYRLGELELINNENAQGAKQIFLKVIQKFPATEEARASELRIKQIDSGRVTQSTLSLDGDEHAVRSSKAKRKDARVVVLDPGHGGEDYGAIGIGSLLEKDVTLDIAFKTAKILDARDDIIVKLTRTRDEFVALADRTNLANDVEASLFISIHTNASPESKLHGMETYYLDNTDDQASKRLAERENASFAFAEEQSDLQFMLSDLIQNAKRDDSIRLAQVIHKLLFDHLKQRWPGIKSLGVKKAPFYVLVGAHMPCALIEIFFIDHAEDGERLAQDSFRAEVAAGLAHGIISFFEKS